MRKSWKLAKNSLEECGIELKEIADKPGFGPALDDFENAYVIWEAKPFPNTKEDKFEANLEAAAKNAADKGGIYYKVLYLASQAAKKEASEDPKKKIERAGIDMALGKIDNILKQLMPFYHK